MRILISAVIFLASSFSFAAGTMCDKWASNPTFVKAISAVADVEGMPFEQLCTLPRILDIEAQPTHLFTREGERIPYTRVQLHGEYDSCLFMVRVSDNVITEQRCYSGF